MLGTAGTEVRIERIQHSLQSDHKPSFKDLRAPKGGLLPIVWIGILLSVFQQFVGINVIFYYSNVLWEAVGFSESDSFKITVITAIVNIVTTLIAIATIDRVGRKPLLIIGSIGMTITLGIMAFVFGIARTTTDASGAVTPVLEGWQGPAALIAANVYVIAFGMSLGAGGLGAARRVVPEQDPRRRAVRRGHGPVGRELADHGQLPEDEGHLARLLLRLLRGVCAAVPVLRHQVGAGDQGQGARGHGRRFDDRAPLRPRPPSERAVRARHTMDGVPTTVLPSRDELLTALSKVNDPEIRKPITELGMVKSVEVDDAGRVAAAIFLTVAAAR